MGSSIKVRDGLTKLLTYDAFLKSADSALAHRSKEDFVAILYMEFDDLSRFNHAFEFNIDDQLLKSLAQSIGRLTDQEMLLGRVGTYSFAIATIHQTREELERLSEKLIRLLGEPLSIDHHMFYVTATIGVCSSANAKPDAYTLLKYAENTMRRLQKEGTNHIGFYCEADDALLKQELQLMRDLPVAIDKGEFYFVYQPQYSYKEGRFTGAEILTRWRHPTLGEISADLFIPLAEKSGMITPLTVQLLIEAFHMFDILEEAGENHFSLSLNISPKVLLEKHFLKNIEFLFELYDFRGKNLTFEIMEDTLAKDIETFKGLLQRLKALNISIAIDDYGTGHTSLKYLIELPIDYLKVDRSLVRHIHSDKRTCLLFKTILDMASALELEVVAEGVEEEAEALVLEEFGDLKVQGYFFAKPLSKEELLAKLR